MKYVYITFIALGILIDLSNFAIRFVQYLTDRKVSSPIPFAGIFLVTIGLINLKVYEFSFLGDILSWKFAIGIWLLALILHMLCQAWLPSLIPKLFKQSLKKKDANNAS